MFSKSIKDSKSEVARETARILQDAVALREKLQNKHLTKNAREKIEGRLKNISDSKPHRLQALNVEAGDAISKYPISERHFIHALRLLQMSSRELEEIGAEDKDRSALAIRVIDNGINRQKFERKSA